jgi:hypothetical protein
LAVTKKLELPTTKVSAVSVSIIATMPQTKSAASNPPTKLLRAQAGRSCAPPVLRDRRYIPIRIAVTK